MSKLVRRCSLAPLLLLVAAVPASAQMDSDIYVAELSIGPSSIEITSVRNATDRPGYDNQPWFTQDDGGCAPGRANVSDVLPFCCALRCLQRIARRKPTSPAATAC